VKILCDSIASLPYIAIENPNKINYDLNPDNLAKMHEAEEKSYPPSLMSRHGLWRQEGRATPVDSDDAKKPLSII
jgi:hypothetical protein